MSKSIKAVLFTALVALGFGVFAGMPTAQAATVSDAVAPWVPVVRYIPVYVDGKLVGYIASNEYVWVPSTMVN